MLVIAAIIVWGILDGMFIGGRMTYSGGLKVSAEGRISEREKCYKLAELKDIDTGRKFTVGEKLICGVLKHGGLKGGINAMKKVQREPNELWRHSWKYCKAQRQ